MLAYLIAISILNILLGYALAVYLMRASQSAEFAQRSMDASKRYPQSTGSDAAGHSASTTAGSVFAPESSHVAAAPSAPAPAAASSPTAKAKEALSGDASRRSNEETDAQLLAGIADFRTQLAKLRSSTTMEHGSTGAFAGGGR